MPPSFQFTALETPAGFKVVNPGPVNVTEFILMYTKNREKYKFKKGHVKSQYVSDYNYFILNPDEHPTKWKIKKIKDIV
ncbi:unnamed protein product, partial [marine sediment metagenome]